MDYSIIEFGVYAFFAYGSMLMLMITMIVEVPKTRAQTMARSMYAIPGIFSAVILSGFSPIITFSTTLTNSTTLAYNVSSGIAYDRFAENATTVTTAMLGSSVWTYFHGMLAAILIVFVIFQILQMLTSKD